MVSCIMHKYVRCAADRVSSSAEFSSIKGIRSIMSTVADNVMRYFEDQHFKPIRDRWMSTIELYTTFFPVDASVRTAMFTMHAPLADMILDSSPHSTGSPTDQMNASLRKITVRSTGGGSASWSSVSADVMIDDVVAYLDKLGKCSRSKLEETIIRKVGELLPSLESE